MKKFLPSVLLSMVFFPAFSSDEALDNTITVYDGAVFYDGYAMENNPDKDLEDGITRHSCSLYSIPLTDEQLDRIGEKLTMHVDVQALCDNYDRIGNVNVAFVHKGATSYIPLRAHRIEIGRFITPFMNKNKKPDTVPYEYDLSYLSPMFRDKQLREDYDFWLELEIFGVPYAAQKEIRGCQNRNDVFKGFLHFETDDPAPAVDDTVLIPIVIKKPEYIGHNLNNYSEDGTDEIGKCVKTYTLDLPLDVKDARIVLITSNHGANQGGEEYNRRQHYVYFDDVEELKYRPGRESCEPFRKYNTQGNGIYGLQPRSDEEWQSFSNWCPGDVIDNRQILLGDVAKGEHKIRIEVPRARFVDKQGDIPVSMYLLAKNPDPAKISDVKVDTPFSMNISNGTIKLDSTKEIKFVEIYKTDGGCVYENIVGDDINISSFEKGIYLINVSLSDGVAYTRKFVL